MLPSVSFLGLKSRRIASHRLHGYGLAQLLAQQGHDVRLNPASWKTSDVVIVGKGARLPPRPRIHSGLPIVGVVSPSLEQMEEFGGRQFDFSIVGSVEEADSLAFGYIPHVYVPQVEPDPLPPLIKSRSGKLTIVYHGNREHLVELSREQIDAFRTLASEYDFRLRLVYDLRRLGKVLLEIEDCVEVEHVQWKLKSFMTDIQDADIGWAPSSIRLSDESLNLLKSAESIDRVGHITKVKRTHNHGRALLMSQLGLPVVAEMTHSHFDLYGNGSGVGGILASSQASWHRAFSSLLESDHRRRLLSEEAIRTIVPRFEATKLGKRISQEIVALHSTTRKLKT